MFSRPLRVSKKARDFNRIDALIGRIDGVLKVVSGVAFQQRRVSPADKYEEVPMSALERRHAAGLMRVNHSGEVCAQALYFGQGLVARDANTQAGLKEAADDETDHLFWCRQRLRELDSRASLLNPLWFAGSLATGVVAAALGDGWSMGFVEETERQVIKHLEGHLEALPDADRRSREIVAMMRDDEARHAANAADRGAKPLPHWVRKLMGCQAGLMTKLAYFI